jgi:hypothetical protein
VPLNYNFNGIVHAGENGQPDNPTGYRSISDRGLDFTAGVPADALLSRYQIVAAAGALDIVHLGNRNTVDFGQRAFDPVPDGDDIGIQPTWLPNPDQTGPQITVLGTPLPIVQTTSATFLYQISNGGGAFDVTFRFAAGGSYTATLGGGDWFGGAYLGTAFTDSAIPSANLSITEGRIQLGSQTGQTVTQIEFGNRTNVQGGYAILAANFDYPPATRRVNQIALAYNFNGIVHAGEAGLPDNPTGFRSISDRALDFTAGVPAVPLLQPYALIGTPGLLDIVHLGDRNTVDNGNWIFDLVPDGDNVGIQPTWLPNTNQTGPLTTTLAMPILIDGASTASFLFQISNGGGSFDVTFTFQSGPPVVASLSGGDWFGGQFLGRQDVDMANVGANLSIAERTVDLSGQAGRVLTAIAFGNRSNLVAGYAILAANVTGCLSCPNAGAVTQFGGGNGATMATSSNGNLGCELEWRVAGATPNAVLGFIALGFGTTSIPLSGFFPSCTGTIRVPNPTANLVAVSPAGTARLAFPCPPIPLACGVLVTGQYAELRAGPCPILLSDALGITVGN